MANAKYDNLVPMLANGRLNWSADKIQAFLVENAVFDKTDKRLADMTGTIAFMTPMPERLVDPVTGSLLGYPASFDLAQANKVYSVILAKEDGSQNPWLIAFYDRDESGGTITIDLTGTLTLRPQGSDPSTPGVWVQFA
jgi:hypothetical protein